jgi:hypothetical protein
MTRRTCVHPTAPRTAELRASHHTIVEPVTR